MWGEKLWLFPIAVFVILPLSFIITYSVAVSNGHVAAGFPYISDTGTQPPESCIFGQLLNISAVLAGITIYIRYRDIDETLKKREIIPSCVRLSMVNNIGLVIGICSAIGASLVANFQETSVLVVHFIGAFMTFGLGAVYCCFQTYITYKVCVDSLRIANLRLFLCIIIIIICIVLFTASTVAKNKFKGGDAEEWHPGEGGFAEHILSTASEWAMAIFMMVYFLTFVKEFRDFGMKCPNYYRHSELQINRGSGQLPPEKGVDNQGEVTCPGSPESTTREIQNEKSGSQDKIFTVETIT